MKSALKDRWWLFLTVVAVSLLVYSGCTPDKRHSRPNIIFIMADDLGYGDLGSYGQRVIRTPYLDQMAEEGIRFTHCYAGSPVCAPSRSVLMTGLHTGHTTVRGNTGIGGVVGLGGAPGRIPLQKTDTTVAEVLQRAGYITGMVGKWGLGEPGTTGLPNDQGFDEFYGFLNQRRAHSYYPDYLWQDTTRVILEGNQNGARGDYAHDLFTEHALDFVSRHRDEQFFLYLPYTIPHDIYEIPDLGPYADSTDWKPDEQVYAAMVTRMDADIGRLFVLLRQLSIDRETIVFFCSDNGSAQYWEGRFDSSGGLRGRKRDLHEGGIRTPMIVRYPGHIPEGVVDTTPWYFADVLPTLASIARAPCPVNLDGIDISPALHMTPERWTPPQRVLYWEFYERGFQQAVRWGKWKAVRLSPGMPWELYDLQADPTEDVNIAKSFPAIVHQMDIITHEEHRPSPFFARERKPSGKVTLLLIGDSTVKNANEPGGIWGWGDLLTPFFDTSRITIVNRARGGRSSRTFITEGLWDIASSQLQPGDFVLMQFGHNDGGSLDSGRARGSLKGTGNETREVIPETTGQKETVHTYGWYMRKYVRETRSLGAVPVVLSMTPRNIWHDGKVERVDETYGKWAAEVAQTSGAWFVDLNEISASRFEAQGPDIVASRYFLDDHTHTSFAGARLNAASVVEGIRALEDCPLRTFLKER